MRPFTFMHNQELPGTLRRPHKPTIRITCRTGNRPSLVDISRRFCHDPAVGWKLAVR
jgi:hypothetical protein